MDAIISKYEKSLQDMKKSAETATTSYGSLQAAATKNMAILESSILELSKCCLNTLSDCNKELIAMSNSINSVEGEVQIIRDSKSKQLQPKAQTPQGIGCPSLLVESRSPNPILIPDQPVINFDCLNPIGGTADQIQENTVLVRKVQPNTDEPQLWTRQKDYFANVQGNSTFKYIYKITV